MLHSQALATGSVRSEGGLSSSSQLLTVLSKDTPVQIWDVGHQKSDATAPAWMAKNVPNDELDLRVPIYDTSLAQCASDPFGRVLAVSTAFGEIRTYDVRASKRATSNNLIVKTAQMLSNLL